MSKHLESGWEMYRREVIPADAPQVQIDETRNGFYGGAWLLWSTIMGTLDSAADPTPADLQLLDELQAELVAFASEKGVAQKGSSRT